MTAIPYIRDAVLALAGLALLLTLGQGWIEKNLLEKASLVQRINACEAKK